MSDITIPGVNSSLNTDKIIDGLMKLERIPLDRMEGTLESYNSQKTVWQELNRKIGELRDSARTLYSFDNPFQERMVESSADQVITATATRQADMGESSIAVNRLAQADRLLSTSLPSDFSVPAGKYTFQVGDESVSFEFRGGSLTAFSDRLNSRGDGLIKSRVVRNTADTQVLMIESTRTGRSNRLTFGDKSLDLALETGIIAPARSSDYSFSMTGEHVGPLNKPVDDRLFSGDNGTLLFPPRTEARITPDRMISDSQNLQLTINYSVKNIGIDESVEPPPPGPDIPRPGSVSIEDIVITNEPSETVLPEWEPPEEPEVVDDLLVFFTADSNSSVPLPGISPANGNHTLTVDLQEYVTSLSSLQVRNNNSHRTISVNSIELTDPTARGDYIAQNPISEAQDAEISIDGITVERDSNAIDDVVPGVTLNLNGTSDVPVTLDVKPDVEKIKNSIINFVGYYNRLMTEINVLTREDSSIISYLDYLSEEEQDVYREKLGLMQGDITLNQLKNRLQRIMMDPYPSGDTGKMALLAQIGISTNAAGPGGGVQADKMRGYLEINEPVLDENIEMKIAEVRTLFGRDTDGDRVVDTGAAFLVDEYAKAYNQNGGIIVNKLRTLDQQIARANSDIENLNDRLDRKENQLRREYGNMEGAMESMQEASKAIQNLNSGGGQ